MTLTKTIPDVFELTSANQYAEELRLLLIDLKTHLDGSVQSVKFTDEGGLAVKLINKTGAASIKGTVVSTYSSLASGVSKIVVDIPAPIGIILEDGIADGSLVWVTVSGIAYVYFVGNSVIGHLARGFITADGASYVAGQAISEAVPTSPFATDKHFYEIGHVIEARTGAGLAKVVLHFN